MRYAALQVLEKHTACAACNVELEEILASPADRLVPLFEKLAEGAPVMVETFAGGRGVQLNWGWSECCCMLGCNAIQAERMCSSRVKYKSLTAQRSLLMFVDAKAIPTSRQTAQVPIHGHLI